MRHQFWLDKWQNNQIGFHEEQPHPLLVEHFPGPPEAGARVLVPLCGKAVDMAWLVEKGWQVVGVEISEIAVRDFFSEQKIPVQRVQHDPLLEYSGESVRLICADYFEVEPHMVGQVSAVYDRAALIAMDDKDRPRYVAHTAQLAPLAPVFLVGLEYIEGQVNPPPFCVDSGAVSTLYVDRGVELVAQRESTVKGTAAVEKGYWITP